MQSIILANGTVTVTPVVVASTATLLVAPGALGDVTIINNGTSVMDVGDSSVTPGGGIPLQPGGGSFTVTIDTVGANVTQTGIYGACPGGSGDARVINRT